MTIFRSRSSLHIPSFRQRLYRLLVEPRQLKQDARNREVVFNVVLAGTAAFMVTLFVLLLISFFALGNVQVLGRVLVAVAAVGFLGFLFWLSRWVSYYTSAYLLVAFYVLLAAGSVYAWGIRTPFGILLLGLVVVLASTILSSRHALYAAAVAILIIVGVQASSQAGWHETNELAMSVKSGFGDVAGQSVMFVLLATISWLFGQGMERSLERATTAEVELEREKTMLETRVAERTEQLKRAQIEEMQQLYRFAEVGQLSTAMLHDLANHLTVLNMEIEGIRGREHADALSRSSRTIGQLNAMIDEVRNRLSGESAERQYNLVDVIDGVAELASYKHEAADIRIDWQPPKKKLEYIWYGDPIKCSQVVAILLGNAIDAYKGLERRDVPIVRIVLEKDRQTIKIRVVDWGVGITAAERKKIFEPDYSTKKSGMGIGLYLAKQMVVTEFSGRIVLSDDEDKTEFTVSLPVSATVHKVKAHRAA